MNRAANTPAEYLDSLGMRFVRIAPGSFLMGAEKPEDGVANGMDNALPRHRVNIGKAFYMARHEVTQAQWEALMGDNPSRNKGRNHPVENVSYVDVQVFIQRLNQREGTLKYRLPTEAEWEYACRAGTETAWFCGGKPGFLDRYAWVDDDVDWAERLPLAPGASMSLEEFLALDEARTSTHPVGGKKPNPWGLYDMHGNVEEWVADWYDPAYYARSPETDLRGPESGQYRVARGGCHGAISRRARSAFRSNGLPTKKSPELGFRIVFTETAGRALAERSQGVLPDFLKTRRTKIPLDTGVPDVPPARLGKRLLSWPLRGSAGLMSALFAVTTGWMALEGERAWYAGLLVAVLFGRYAQDGKRRVFQMFLGDAAGGDCH